MEIKCPHCNQVFNLDADMASHIRDQIRTQEFEREVQKRVASSEAAVNERKNNEIALAVARERESSLKTINEYSQKLKNLNPKKSSLKCATLNQGMLLKLSKLFFKLKKSIRQRLGNLKRS